MSDYDFSKIIDAAHSATEKHGVQVRGGKKYSQVSTRIELFRREFGANFGIETEVLQAGVRSGEAVMIRAVIRDKEGFIIATGTACETVGDGNVNKTSALENAETSAVGRALAVLGLHGGEMASLNEIDAVGRKEENFASSGLGDTWEDAIFDSLPPDPSEQGVAEAYSDRMMEEATAYKTKAGVNSYLSKHKSHLDFVERHLPEAHSALKSFIINHRDDLEK